MASVFCQTLHANSLMKKLLRASNVTPAIKLAMGNVLRVPKRLEIPSAKSLKMENVLHAPSDTTRVPMENAGKLTLHVKATSKPQVNALSAILASSSIKRPVSRMKTFSQILIVPNGRMEPV